MPDGSPTIKRLATGVMLVALVVTAGCESTMNWLKGRRTAEATPVILGAPEANSYLDELYELASGDPATQAEIYIDAANAATLTPGPSTELRYALVLATPGHAESNGVEAQSRLREILARPELMTQAEIALATIYLKDVEARIVLDAEARRLRAENSAAETTEQAAIARRIARIEAENRALRESLADAEAKLEAITSIEQSIRQQTGENNPP